MGSRNLSTILKPSVDCLRRQGKLLLDASEMGEFLGVEEKKVHQLTFNDRIPLPVSVGFGKCRRWSVIELLEWVEAGCPRRTEWIAARGQSGWFPYWRTRS
jgi:predicted DNA-binding transcriptional regulator AlpA